jgi:transglutaminase-like putative cysteine protease
MWLRIEHTTSFDYDDPITEAYTELRQRPLDGAGQHCSSFRLVTEPPGVRIRSYTDHLGNDVQHFDVLEPHDRLVVTAVSEVQTPHAFADEQRRPSPLELHDYLLPTAYAPFSDEVRAFAEANTSEGSATDRAAAIMGGVFSGLTFEPGATDVKTRADEALELGRGVCQDFAHLLIAACRIERIPTRYVSGYIYDPTLEGAAAQSHAWVDVYDPERGWVALDPTHDRAQTDEYVRVAVGRDYGDVPPTRGVYKGSALETLAVRVTVTAL